MHFFAALAAVEQVLLDVITDGEQSTAGCVGRSVHAIWASYASGDRSYGWKKVSIEENTVCSNRYEPCEKGSARAMERAAASCLKAMSGEERGLCRRLECPEVCLFQSEVFYTLASPTRRVESRPPCDDACSRIHYNQSSNHEHTIGWGCRWTDTASIVEPCLLPKGGRKHLLRYRHRDALGRQKEGLNSTGRSSASMNGPDIRPLADSCQMLASTFHTQDETAGLTRLPGVLALVFDEN